MRTFILSLATTFQLAFGHKFSFYLPTTTKESFRLPSDEFLLFRKLFHLPPTWRVE